MNQKLKEAFRYLIYLVYAALPKRNHAVIYGWPDYEDSALALEKALNTTSVQKVIFFVSEEISNRFQLGRKTKVVRKDSLRGFLYFAFSKYVFFTARCFMSRFPRNVVSVNVWHGMPIKTIGWMQQGHEGIASRYALATSEFWAEIMQRAMTPFQETLVTGLPRNDRLFSDPGSVWRRLGFNSATPFNRAVAWLPTYRKSVRGELLNDGRETGNTFGMPGITADALNKFLKKRNAFGFVKPHPMAPFNGPFELSNLLVVDDRWLRDRALTLYEVLGQMDVLITDISSVVVDYLILDRPVIHSFPDISEYQSSRGFSINPITDYFVGPVATNAVELMDGLVRTLEGQDSHAVRRREIRTRFHENPDSHSTQRLLKSLGMCCLPTEKE